MNEHHRGGGMDLDREEQRRYCPVQELIPDVIGKWVNEPELFVKECEALGQTL